MMDDGSCIRCGCVPRNASGLCATCVDEDAVRAGEVEDDASQALWRQALDQERVPAAPGEDVLATARTEARKAALEEAAKMAHERGRLALAASESMPGGILREREAAAGAELIGFASAIRALIGADPTTDSQEG